MKNTKSLDYCALEIVWTKIQQTYNVTMNHPSSHNSQETTLLSPLAPEMITTITISMSPANCQYGINNGFISTSSQLNLFNVDIKIPHTIKFLTRKFDSSAWHEVYWGIQIHSHYLTIFVGAVVVNSLTARVD
ncbi:hypothetical protein J6590_084722 [Homalodisca vitripennis]|nr:hypothetical protein J6590_084722 [Homalodisca vitripennis]